MGWFGPLQPDFVSISLLYQPPNPLGEERQPHEEQSIMEPSWEGSCASFFIETSS